MNNSGPSAFFLLCVNLLVIAAYLADGTAACATERPNVVLIFIDDMGYGDIGPFGNTVNKTPNLDRMAAEGNVLRQFYVANTACTPSRTALMTGTYAHRIGMDGSVVFPGEKRGLNPDEITIAELLKQQGYATGCFGKWHLGDQPEFLPLAQGFDQYFGIPYSNDMWPGNKRGNPVTNRGPYTPLPIIRQNEAVAYVSDGADQSLLCEVVTDEAVKFVKAHQKQPFFLYVPHAYVHNPRYARPEIYKKAEGNVNRSNVEEVDTSVGRILDTLRELKLAESTLVVFTSDNGGAGGMSMGPLRGGKGGPKYEGHMREPTITWWPKTIPAGVETNEIAVTTDILPSLAKLVGASVPDDRTLDGKDVLDILLGKAGAKSPHEIHYYEVDAIRRGPWKLIKLPRPRGKVALYNLDDDIGEQNDLAAKHPDLVTELSELLAAHAERIAADTRAAAFIEDAKPIISEPGDLPRLRDFMGMPDVRAANNDVAAAVTPKSRKPLTGGDKVPDVLFIAIDDMNDWTTLFDENNPIQTPNLRRLASRGAFFSKAYCVVPACNPSRTAILTGLSPVTSGVYSNGQSWKKLLPDVVTLPQYFGQQGYTTKGGGKIFHHGGTGSDRENNPSFEEFFKLRIHANKPEVNYNGYVRGRDAKQLASPSWDWGVHDVAKQTDDYTIEYVAEVMETESRDKPLFLAAGIFRPHLPFWAPPESFTRYPLDDVKLPPRPAGDLDDVPPIGVKMSRTESFIFDNTIKPPEDRPGSLKKMVQCYQAAADYADQMVGRLLDKLDQTGRAGNTIIVLWSDHGYHLGDKNATVKFTLWEKANHVPLIIVAPGVTNPGIVIDRPVSLLDIYPTLAELAGLPIKNGLDGVSLVPLLNDPKARWDRPAVMTQGEDNHAVRSDRWRYIHYADGTEELYDHDNDPWEHTNLARRPEFAQVIARHKKSLPGNRTPPQTRTATKTDRRPVTNRVTRIDVTPAVYKPAADDILIADFEGKDYGDWKATGDAFGDRPAVANVTPRNRVTGYLGKGLVNTYLNADKSTGDLTSPPFTIQRKHINLLIGGGKHRCKSCCNLLVDGKTVRTATGFSLKDSKGREVMDWKSWEVAELVGKRATLRIVDEHAGGWGHINVDHIFQSNQRMPSILPEKLTEASAAAPVRSPTPGASETSPLAPGEMDPSHRTFATYSDVGYDQKLRPQFHFTSRKNWINDPNGMVYYDGEWHLYFQHCALSVNRGRKSWGHAVSTDMVHWKQLPHAILPYDRICGTAQIAIGNNSKNCKEHRFE